MGATRLPTDAGTGTLVDTDTASYRATQDVREVFGEEPVVVLAEGDLQRLILTPNLGRLLRLEGCLSGKVPRGAKPIPGPCAELAAMDPVEFVAGPATFLNEAVIQIDQQLQPAGRDGAARPACGNSCSQVAARYGITSAPSIGNPDFLAAVVFDLGRSRGTPKAQLAYLFPNNHSTQIILRLRPGPERRRTQPCAGADPRRRLRHHAAPRLRVQGPAGALLRPARRHLHRSPGAPVVIEGLSGALKDALLVLLAVAFVVMALTLLSVFRSRLRLLPLAVALAAAAITFGLLCLLGGSLTAASIAVLPILIGLVVDYAIQLQARFDEAVAGSERG